MPDDFSDVVWGEENRNLARRVGVDWGPDHGLQVNRLIFAATDGAVAKLKAAAAQQSLQAPPAGQITNSSGGFWFTVNRSIIDGPDLIQ